MNKKLLIGIVAFVILAGGGSFFLLNNLDENSNNQTNDSVQQETTDSTDASSVFPANSQSYPVRIRGEVTDSANAESNGTLTMAFQSESVWSMTMDLQDGTSSTILYIDNMSYFENPEDGTWMKIPFDGSAESPTSSYGIDESSHDQYRQSAAYQGKEACSLGTCDIWVWTDPANSSNTATIKFGSDGRVAEISTHTGTATSTLAYDYDTPVNIEVPANVAEFEFPTIPDM